MNNSNKLFAKPFMKNMSLVLILLFIASFSAGCSYPISSTDKCIAQENIDNDIVFSLENDSELTYPIVHTAQTEFFSDKTVLQSVKEGEDFFGQDGNYIKNSPSYTDNSDGTITDNITGLMWQKTMDKKMSFIEAKDYASSSKLAGYDDWRIPTIKELFSLIDYNGISGGQVANVFYIDTEYFDQPLGDTSKGEREIDAQTWSSTEYVGKTMNNSSAIFGVNFIDGRIKGYPKFDMRSKTDKKMYQRLVRGNEEYGKNQFVNNQDGTISDLSTGLMWQISDDGETRNWKDSLAYSENLDLAGYTDWRLPNAKELQSIIDYSRSPQTTNSPAIYDDFKLTSFIDSLGKENWGFYWTGSTHKDGRNTSDSAAYICFGEALGKMQDRIMDVHGAGAVRSDPKNGNRNDYPQFFGPQGDIRYVFNYVLSVRDISK